MKESIEKLFKKMNEDKAFAEKLLSQTENEKLIEVAKEEGIELALEDIAEANEIIAKAMEKKNEGELSEDELENVAGGGFIMTAISVSVATAQSAAATLSVALSAIKIYKELDD